VSNKSESKKTSETSTKVDEVANIKYVTVTEAMKYMGIGTARIRQIINTTYKDGSIKIEGKRDKNNDWMISLPSIHVWIQKKQAREVQRVAKVEEMISGDFKYPYTRPRVQTIKMLRTELDENGKKLGTPEQIDIVQMILDKIEAKWAKEYSNRKRK